MDHPCHYHGMFTGKPEHIKGFDYLGLRQYFLTFCSYSRRRCFVTDDAVVTVRTQIERAAAEQDIALLAYCYMPDHVHLVAEGKAENSDCRQFIKRGTAISVARYILENPVRAGLVTRIQDYPYSGSSAYSIEQILEAVQLRDMWYRRSG
jgi:putative transposase